MSFSSLSFLFAFLPLTLILYHLSPNPRWRNGVLLFTSLFFYAWGAPKALPLLVGTALLVWLCGLGMEKGLRFCYPLAVAFVLGSLLLFKYLGFFASIFGARLSFALLLPAGISFTTFQLLAYLFDLRRGEIRAERSFFRFLLFVAFFPQLLQGPILRCGKTVPMLGARVVTWDGAVCGMRRFLRGLAKKVLIADQVAVAAAAVYGSSRYVGTGALWLAALCYTLQIYFDFSGYSDMAIGLGQLFGFTLPENFDHPYTAVSITDFWRRWHITLSLWFRDYVYIPLGGNRVSRGRFVLNILIVWALTGLWHGASWNFVLWGLYYGVLLLIEKLVIGKRIEGVPTALRRLLTFALVNVGWVLFHIGDPQDLLRTLKTMFVFAPTDWRSLLALDASVCSKLVMILPALLFCFPFPKKWTLREDSVAAALAVNGFYAALLVLCVLFTISASFTPFIYFNF